MRDSSRFASAWVKAISEKTSLPETSAWVDRFVNELQSMEGIGGPSDINEYILILELVKREISTRIENAHDRSEP